jgi:hypothetical protein
MESAFPVVLCAIPLAAIVTAVYSILSAAINVLPPIRAETISLENDYVALSNQLEDVAAIQGGPYRLDVFKLLVSEA